MNHFIRTIKQCRKSFFADLSDGRVERKVKFAANGLDLFKNPVVFVFAQRHQPPFADAGFFVGDHFFKIYFRNGAQPVAVFAGAIR